MRQKRQSVRVIGGLVAMGSVVAAAVACGQLVGLEEHRLEPPTALGGSAAAGGELTGGAGVVSGGSADAGGAGVVSGGSANPGDAPPSCASQSPGAGQDCGRDGNADCCASFAVPGGNAECRTLNETIEPFRLDQFEVTVGRFRLFAAAVDAGFRPPEGSGQHPPGANHRASDTGWKSAWNAHLPTGVAGDTWSDHFRRCDFSTWTEDDLGYKEWLPISCTTYYHALAFCIWDGGYLPSFLEQSHVASGGNQSQPYPWGDGPLDDEHAIYRSPERETPEPVGSVPAGDGRWGHSDLVGNVWEWSSFNGSGPGDCSGCDCDRFVADYRNGRVFGGSYDASAAEASSRSLNRVPLEAGSHQRDDGIRCARAP